MPYIDWFDQLATGVENVDNQQQKLVSLFRDLHDSLRQDQAES